MEPFVDGIVHEMMDKKKFIQCFSLLMVHGSCLSWFVAAHESMPREESRGWGAIPMNGSGLGLV